MEDTNKTLLFALLFGEEKEKTKHEINKEVNQRILFELFLREKFENNDVDKMYNELKEQDHNVENHKKLSERLLECNKSGIISLNDLTRFIDMNKNFEKTDRYGYGSVSRNYAKEFFEWAKEKAKEMGMPKNTFKTIHGTKVIARNMFANWYKRFKTTEEMVNWFTQENDIMLK